SSGRITAGCAGPSTRAGWIVVRRAVAGTPPGPRSPAPRRRPLATVGRRPAGPRLPTLLPGVPGPPGGRPARSPVRGLLDAAAADRTAMVPSLRSADGEL